MTEREKDEMIDKLLDDVRAGFITRFSGGGSIFDFKLDRHDAEKRVKRFMEETK